MNRNDNYFGGKKKNHRKNDRNERQDKNTRVNRNEKPNRSDKNEKQSKNRDFKERKINGRENVSSSKNQKNIQLKEFHNEIQRILQKDTLENENAIRKYRSNVKVCAICKLPMKADEVNSAVSDKVSQSPSHFDCVLKQVSESEKLEPNEKIAYIGQGRFAVICFENPHDTKHFSIKKIIEWENRDNRVEWRNEISSLFSQIM